MPALSLRQTPQHRVSPPAGGELLRPVVKRIGRPFEVRCSLLDVGSFCLDYSPRLARKFGRAFSRRDAG